MRIGLTSVYVDDQDKARSFYSEVLGFQVKTDAPYTETERWISVVSPEEPGGTQLVLHLADEAAKSFQAASRAAGRPSLALVTDDCERSYQALRAKGVLFTMPPTQLGYGGTDAVFEDGFGNLIDLHQD
jgi:catechol 2,3-dioxygenase-like lactoylglutathione lyase family enzyme